MLNSIGLDNDGIELFIAHHLPYLADLGVPIIVSIAGRSHEEFVRMTSRLDGVAGVAVRVRRAAHSAEDPPVHAEVRHRGRVGPAAVGRPPQSGHPPPTRARRHPLRRARV